ncbi:MAG TPA: Asp-tRNA(Asn)/Glu-tRNA(Gln) amidotransferase subunit GatC [Xanthomonadales bacterium]|nr:Asp-tRNA(Asn)/Glu-tRNA(Gln) amidotransferase subunit GatC [Xanthomonadales bacterium]
MHADPALIEHLARLSRLALDDADKQRLADELPRVIALLDELARAPVDGVAPLAHPLELSVRLREDAVTEGDRSDELLALSSEAQGGYFIVPRVID